MKRAASATDAGRSDHQEGLTPMATTTLSQATLNEAHQMALQSHTWSHGRSKRNGREFFVIPSRSEAGKAHYTTSYGCTCRGFLKRGDCAHAEAVRMHEARERFAPAVKPLKTNEEVYGLVDAF